MTEASKPKAKAAKAPKAAQPESPEASAPEVTEAAAIATAKKPKKDAVEDKPFEEFIRQDFLPALEKAFAAREFQDLELVFASNQVMGKWDDGQKQFTVYFPDATIQGRKAFSDSSDGIPASTIESFLIDERKVTLDLLVFGVMQRINAQKWFRGN